MAFWVVAIILRLIFGAPEDQELVNDLKAQDSLPVLIGFATLVCIVAPLAEEFVFRGFLFRVLWERTNVGVAAVVSGALFGLVHKEAGPEWLGVVVLGAARMPSCVSFSLARCLWCRASCCMRFTTRSRSASLKELPWWGFLLLVFGSVTTTLAISLLAMRLRPAAPSRAPALSPF